MTLSSAPASLHAALGAAVRAHGDAMAFVCGETQRSWRELAADVAETEAILGDLGLGPGHVVAMLAGNDALWPRWLHALSARGASLLALNVRLTVDELAFQLADAGASLLVVRDGALAERAAVLAARLPDLVVVRVDAMGVPVESVEGLRVGGPLAGEGPMAILYTSGTTGRPKGVRLPWRAFRASARASERGVPLVAGARWLACMPLFHVGGLMVLVRTALTGATAVIHRGFDAAAVARELDRGLTHASFVPQMLGQVLDARGDASAPAPLRCVLLGGGAATDALVEAAWARDWPVMPTYGLTEACSQVATRARGDRAAPVRGRLRPLEGVEVRVRDADGRVHARAAEGEVLVRGDVVTEGYVGHAATRAARGSDGFLATGDVGRLDDEGLLEVLDRRDDLIVSGGENVYPAEVEAALCAHDAVADAAVVARPDARFGARPVAYWVAAPGGGAPGDDELEAFLRTRLGGYKVPAAFERVAELPRTSTGKVRRAELRERARGDVEHS